jgi:formylglycine-generating enzyme required for sulfatase activity
MIGFQHSTMWWSSIIAAIILLMPVLAFPQEKTFVNSVGMEFTLIPAGTFVMGSGDDDPLRGKGETQHEVTISRPFYMQTTEVTLGQWRKLMAKGVFGFFKRRKGPDNLPVNRTCFHDVESFLEKLNALGEGEYRLPSEAQWEYAARAGTQTAYSCKSGILCLDEFFDG